MSALSVYQLDTGLSDLLKDPANRHLLKAIEAYCSTAHQLGYFNPVFSSSALQQLVNVSEEKKYAMAAFLSLSAKWVEEMKKENSGISERRFLQRALDHYGLQIDDEFLATIDDETVVEIYNQDMIQIYRSFKMLNMTGYSVLDLCVHEWYVLWERPQLAIQQMYKEGVDILQSEATFKVLPVTPHILKETLNTGMTEPFIPRNCMVNFQHIGFLKATRPDAPRAFICTSKGRIIAEGHKETSQIAFL